jgi:hypothetical protein
MGHNKRGDMAPIRVMPIKMTWHILGTDRIDMSADGHVEVSRTRGFGVIVENHAKCTSATKMGHIWKLIFSEFICRILLIKGSK